MKYNLYLKLIVLILILASPQWLYCQFGKNKVQYQEFTWKFIESSHFDIYYVEGSKYLAEYAAIESEKALLSIQTTLNYRLTGRVIIILYNTHNEFQQSNVVMSFMPEGVGGVTELFKNRIVIPFQGDYSQFRHVVHHELVHAVLNDMFYGGTFQSALLTSGMFKLPNWINEGLAEYESIGGLDPQTDMFIRDATISENLPPLARLDGYLAYRGGQTFYWYVAEKYGKEKITDFINRLRIHRNLESTFQSCFGMSFVDFSERWLKEIKKQYFPDLDKFSDPDDFANKLTDHFKDYHFYNSSPAISPNGDQMAYISDRDGVFGVWVRTIDDKKSAREIVSSFRQQDFEDLNMLTPGISWDPTGKKLAISAKAGGEDAVFITDAQTGDYDKLTFGIKSISSVQWSPDAKSLAFIGSVNEKSDIYVYDLKSKNLQRLTNDFFYESHPVWAWDSKKIYFISDRGDNLNSQYDYSNFTKSNIDFKSSDIYRIDVGSKAISRITYEPDFDKTSIAISPDESKLLYVSDRNGIGNIYELDIKSNKSKPKTNSLNGITQLSISPDGSKLLFCTQIKVGYDIYMIRFPFEKNIENTDLPLTKLRVEQLKKTKIEHDIAVADSAAAQGSENSEINYGDFDLDFSRQQVVHPNADAAKSKPNGFTEALKGEKSGDSVFTEHDYKLKFSPDVIMGNPGYSTYYGLQGITQMLFSDVLGDHQIYCQANLLIDLRNSTFFIQYNYLPEIIDYSLSAFHSAAFVYASNDSLYRFRNYGISAFASYPFDLFNRLEWGINWLNLSKENINEPTTPSVTRMLFVPEGRYVHDDALWGYYAPVRGTRYYIGFKGAPKFTDDGIGFMTVDFDYRAYLDLNDYLNIAVRGTAGASFGPNPQKFFLGGTENWINSSFFNRYLPFDEPEDFAFMQFVMPMRGYAVSELTGSKYFLFNFELRFPLFRALLAGPVPILFEGVMGSLFLDVGGAWNNEFVAFRRDTVGNLMPNDLLTSSGIGIRTYFLGIPFKIDIAWRYEYSGWSLPEYLLSLGLDY